MDRDYVVECYWICDGKVLFEEWIIRMCRKGLEIVLWIFMCINCVIKYNFGDYKYFREGVWEM